MGLREWKLIAVHGNDTRKRDKCHTPHNFWADYSKDYSAKIDSLHHKLRASLPYPSQKSAVKSPKEDNTAIKILFYLP